MFCTLYVYYDGPGFLTCYGGPEATIHRNTWQQGRPWSDREELGVGVECKCWKRAYLSTIITRNLNLRKAVDYK